MDKNELISIIKQLQDEGRESMTVDAKLELTLHENGDKAEFVKDIIAMANNGQPSFLVIGLVDGTFDFAGKLANHSDSNTINQILADKIDPPLIVDYQEFVIGDNECAVITIDGEDRPYVVARDIINNRADRKKSKVYKGMIFIRHGDRTTGISRIELDRIYNSRKPNIKISLELTEAESAEDHKAILFYISNDGPVTAYDIEVLMMFEGCKIVEYPDEEYLHITDHFGNPYEEKTLVITLSVLLKQGISPPYRFKLAPDPSESEDKNIHFVIRGSNVEQEEFYIPLDDITDSYQAW